MVESIGRRITPRANAQWKVRNGLQGDQQKNSFERVNFLFRVSFRVEIWAKLKISVKLQS